MKNAEINCDILHWDYQQHPVKHFDVIWASPPCTEYSKAKTTGVRQIDDANKIVLKTIRITKYFEPAYFFIENPQTRLLKKQEFMNEFDFIDVDYCKYGFRYRKRARIWNNLCECGHAIGKRHVETAQRLLSGKNVAGVKLSKKTHSTIYIKRLLY